MAELTPDPVTCVCGKQWDRNNYSHCPDDATDLWQLDRVVLPEALDPEPVHPDPDGGAKTFLEPDAASGAGIDILVCGHRLTVRPGQVLRLGREDDFETAEVFEGSKNVSREHAELRFDGGRLYVKDTDSSNHTYVNDQEIPTNTEYELRPGQTLRFASNVPVDIQWPT